MATSGTLSPGGGYQTRTLYMAWSLASQSVAGNYSVINWTLYSTGGSSSWYYHYKEQLYIYGAWRYNNTAKTKRYTGAIASGSITVPHDANGNASFSAELYGAVYTAAQNVAGSGSWALPTIPRVSDLSLNKSSVPADGQTAVIATATKKSSSFTDTLTVKLGTYSKTISSGVAFTIPKDWINAIPGTSATATVTVTTKSGSTVVGSRSASLTATVPSDVVPSISGIAATEAATAVTQKFGNRFVKTLSQLNVQVDATGVYGSTIKACSVQLDGVNYIQQAFTSNVLNTAGSVEIKAAVTDSRGRAAALTKNITVVDYTPPVVASLSYFHCNADGTRNSAGNCIKVTVKGAVSSVEGQNTRALKLKYKPMSGEAYTERAMTLSAWDFTAETIIQNTDHTVTYEIVAELTDKISTTVNRITTGVPVISRLAGGKGVRLFGEAEEEGFWVGNVDYTITDAEFDELLGLLGGGSK